MTRTIHIAPPVVIKNWIRANLVECRAAIDAIDKGLPFADGTTDGRSLAEIQSAMRTLVEESQMIGVVRRR